VAAGSSVVWNGSEFIPCTGVPPEDRGFRYGMSIFETIACVGGVPLFFREHVEKLRERCATWRFAFDDECVPAAERLLRGRNLTGTARLYVTAGPGRLDEPPGHGLTVMLFEDRPRGGIRRSFSVASVARVGFPVMPGTKTGNYWPHAELSAERAERGVDEVLVFGSNDRLVSAATSNVFAFVAGRWVTPASATGCRCGVIRDWVFAQMACAEGEIARAEIAGAEELFVTNSWLGVQPVTAVDGRPLDTRRGAAVAAQFAREIEMQCRNV
jgi:branched-chain amino acid aminotransferase